jgi:CNT family concentrative nucleoside transporter
MPIGISGAPARASTSPAACHRACPAPISTPRTPRPLQARKAPALLDRFIGIAGIIVILAIAFLLSSNRRAIRLRVVGSAFALQAGIAVLVLLTPWGREVIQWMSNGVAALLGYAGKGTEFLFGDLTKNVCLLGVPDGGVRPITGQSVAAATTFECTNSAHAFAIAALPVIIFFAAVVAILYHLGIMQRIVRWVGGAIGWLTGIGRVEALGSAANIFVGQSESPLVVRPYLSALAPSQLFTLMTVGMAGVAGTILAAYAGLLGPDSLPFLLAAAFMSAPGGILMAKMIMPDDPPKQEELPLAGDTGAAAAGPAEEKVELAETFEEGERPANIIMAAGQGAQTGVKLAVAVGAMVLAFVALVALANGILSGIGGWFGAEDLTFQKIVGTIFQPVMYLIGIPWAESAAAGGLFGTKIVLNEFVAFIDLGAIDAAALSERSRAIITFALCGFANFSSIAIQLAVTGNLAPNQRPTIAKLGIRALIAGSLANLMSAALAGLLLP